MFEELLLHLFQQNGLEKYLAFASDFEQLYQYLIQKNQALNLTAVTDPEEVIVKHFSDCLKIADLIPESAWVLDVGCGGGFPSLPLAIVRPDLQIVSLDSIAKKLQFVSDCAERMHLRGVQTLNGRAELFAKQAQYRQQFDVVVSRAVAELCILAELCLPFVRVGGRMIAMKGAAAEEEQKSAAYGIAVLGGQIQSADCFQLSDGSLRQNIVIDKKADTPDRYPRPYAKMKKMPLREGRT